MNADKVGWPAESDANDMDGRAWDVIVVGAEFGAFLECGILAHGFLRVRPPALRCRG